MNVFYATEIEGDTAFLDEVESGHAVRVLRMKEGDEAIVADGKGGWFAGMIENAHPKKCTIRIISSQYNFEKRNYRLTMAVAPTKSSDRIEWFLEKATEIGIDHFVPIRCSFGERKNINLARLEKIALSAMKQSLKAWLPEISEMVSFGDFIAQPFKGKKLIAHCYPGQKPHLRSVVNPGENVLVLIGPEGDFSSEEVKLALENGFQEISLGQSRLRTETAALVACTAVAIINES
jgi:16S rRNA (uracil1498-N3)-methyltransferase